MEENEKHRFGETEDRFHPKSSRIFRVNDLWFFYTREEGIIGPYKNKILADDGIRHYLQDLLEKNMIHAA